jgi:hypothetical protein
MRSLQLLTLALLATTVMADPMPRLVWTGDPIIAGFMTRGSATQTGMTVKGNCFEPDRGCFDGGITADRPFTVTSPGTFKVIGSEETTALISSCDPNFCFSSAFGAASFSGAITLLPTDFGFGFSDNGSAASPNAEVFINLRESQSRIVTLPLGNYTLEESYVETAGGSGDSGFDFALDTSVIPTPEPQGYGVFLGAAFIAMLCWRHRHQPTSQRHLLIAFHACTSSWIDRAVRSAYHPTQDTFEP